MATRDEAWRQFSALCNDLRDAKTAKSASDAITNLQVFLSDAHHRQLVHRWRSWGFLLHRLLHVIRTEMRACLDVTSKRKRKTSASSTMASLQNWHYLRTELETAHVTADGPMLHLDANGRDCIRQLFTFSVAVIKCQKPVAFGQNLEVLVDKEAWLTVEVLVQYRVYCVVLDYEEWRSILERTLRSFSPDLDSGRLTGDVQTATTRARVLGLLLKNSPFDLSFVTTSVILQITAWFEAVNVEHKADLLLSISSTLMETLTDMMRTNSGAIAPLLLRRGVVVLEFICKSNRDRKNGLRGAPAEFVMQFLDLYRHNVTAKPGMCSLSPNVLLCEMKKLVHVAMGPGEISLVMTHFNSARERRLGNALGIDDQEIRRLACTADIIFHHDHLVSEQIQSATGDPKKYGTLPDQFSAGSKHPRFTTADLAWEVVTMHIFESPRTETQYVSASSVSPASQRQTQSVAYLSSSSRASQSRRIDAKQTNDSGSWLLLLLSILRRHGDYYMSNRIGDLIMVMQKLGYMLVVKEMGKLQSLTLHVLIQMASLSARFRDEFNDHLSEHWANVWQNLLRPDLPYARITEGLGLTRGQAGDARLMVQFLEETP
uniref:Uncharacterized protein n=1 Tax=Hyaloperonospora arabidopsidis (strain Emoy2) TaxID=559515 RepID=M4B889_HYAAE